jgi:DNA topoisomerase I
MPIEKDMSAAKTKIHKIYADPEASASVAGLRYFSDTQKGFTRQKEKGGFGYYNHKNEPLLDERTLERITSLRIPPAWTQVWICPSPRGHLQATGRDAKSRKQYLYHPAWQQVRSLTKFGRMIAFGESLEYIRQQIQADLSSRGMTKRKVTAVVINLLDQALIRIGNRHYARSNKSYGLTTLRDKHVKENEDKITLKFVGKKGIEHEVDIKDKKLAQLVKKCKEIPGYDLFQYYDEHGERQTIESGDVNEYIRNLTKHDFTAKDFRTWGGTVRMVECLENIFHDKPDLKVEKAVKEAVKKVAEGLGNTPAVCTKYYIHPEVIDLFRKGELISYLKKHDAPATDKEFLSGIEKLVIKMLKSAARKQQRELAT